MKVIALVGMLDERMTNSTYNSNRLGYSGLSVMQIKQFKFNALCFPSNENWVAFELAAYNKARICSTIMDKTSTFILLKLSKHALRR